MKPTTFLSSIIILSLLASSCGTTHHFLPPRPLEKGEMMISFAWHQDFNGLHLPDVTPDCNLYFGAGKDYNVGFGFKIPEITINHLTAARYWPKGNSDYRTAYLHLNQVMGVNSNPYLELGGAYIKRDGSTSQIFSAGLGLGTGLANPLVDFRRILGGHRLPYSKNVRLIPYAKYVVAGSEFGFSASYYFGSTKAALKRLTETFERENKPILTIKGEEIESLTDYGQGDQYPYGNLGIILNTGDTVEIECSRYVCGTGFGSSGAVVFYPIAVWFGDWYEEFLTGRSGHYCGLFPEGPFRKAFPVYTDIRQIKEKAERGEDIVFTKFSPEFDEELKQMSESVWPWDDLSVSISTIQFKK